MERLIVLLLVCLAKADVDDTRVFLEEDQHLSPRFGWKLTGEADDNATTRLVFAVKHSNVETLKERFVAVSTPGNPSYGKFMELDELLEMVSPSVESQTAVVDWLRSSGVSVAESCDWTLGREFLSCDVSSSVASALLNVKLYTFRRRHLSVIRATEHYSLPQSVAEHVDFVGGLHRFPDVRRSKDSDVLKQFTKRLLDANKTNAVVDPDHLRTLYKVGSTVGADSSKNLQAVSQFLDQHYKASDLEMFFREYGKNFKHLSTVAKVIGPNSGLAGIEASLDIEYIMSTGANIPTWFWSTGGRHEGQEPFLEWITLIANTSTIPWVMSISYGDNEDSLSVSYMDRINQEFQKQGVRGLSILFASGDDGAGCHNGKFRPNFPASSPYVTSVGATENFMQSQEQAVSFSSGGFSNVFARSKSQSSAVEEFLSTSKKLPAEKYYNKTGRGYPDVSALGVSFAVVCNGHVNTGVAGTSCSAPTFAGVISLVNDALINQHGKTPLGFLNPFLYQHASSVNDITEGCNSGCGFEDRGFCAQKGWDPVTGLGTPNYPELLKAALNAKSLR